MSCIKRALISVSDKAGVVGFAQKLHDFGVQILSTGGTAELLAKSGIPVLLVADYTGFPEMMDGRIKTLHPKIHGDILGQNQPVKKSAIPSQQNREPGLFDYIGSFPVWLLRIIDVLTPDFLISKTPPKKKKVRI